MQLVPRQIIKPDHLYDMEIDSLYIIVKNLCSICNIGKLFYCLKVIIKAMNYFYACISKLYLSLLSLKIKLLKLNPLKLGKSWKNITTKIQKQVLLNQQYIFENLRSYFDKYKDNDINSYCQYYQKNYQKNRRLVIYQNINYQNTNYGIGISIIGKAPLCHHHINLGRNILPKLVPKICQRIQSIIYGTVGLTPG